MGKFEHIFKQISKHYIKSLIFFTRNHLVLDALDVAYFYLILLLSNIFTFLLRIRYRNKVYFFCCIVHLKIICKERQLLKLKRF
jgi:hypothetical protein